MAVTYPYFCTRLDDAMGTDLRTQHGCCADTLRLRLHISYCAHICIKEKILTCMRGSITSGPLVSHSMNHSDSSFDSFRH